MKKVFNLFAIFTFSISLGHARNLQDKYVEYFQHVLLGKQVNVPVKKIKFHQLENYRKVVWEGWTKANQIEKNHDFPILDSLCVKTIGHWTLPSELEPNATLPFYWGFKGIQPESGYPLFLYLHGSGPKDYEWEASHQLAQIFADSPSIYFIPQIPNEGPWYRWWQKSKQFAWEYLFRKTMLRQDIDPNRLYVFGISEGGYGSQRLASFYADYLAGAGPMAGGEPLKNAPAENLSNIGFSLLTGADDYGFYRNKLTTYTKESLDSLQDLYPNQYKHHIELIPGRGHHIDYRPTTPWLSKFRRNPWPKHFIWEDFEMDGIHRSGFYNLYIQERPNDNLRTRYHVDIYDNTIRISVDNIKYFTLETDSIYGIEMKFNREYEPAQSGKFTIFLNEHLVNFKKPVAVFVNGKKIFEDKIKLDISHLLHSTSIFFDRERMYPAAIEVEI